MEAARLSPAESAVLKRHSQMRLSQLTDPIHCGWMEKEGLKTKKWERRWFVLWPRNYDDEYLGLLAPILFYFDDDEEWSQTGRGPGPQAKPRGLVYLRDVVLGAPGDDTGSSVRGSRPWAFRLTPVNAGRRFHKRALSGTNPQKRYVLSVGGEEELDAWTAVLRPFCTQLDVGSVRQRGQADFASPPRGGQVLAQPGAGAPADSPMGTGLPAATRVAARYRSHEFDIVCREFWMLPKRTLDSELANRWKDGLDGPAQRWGSVVGRPGGGAAAWQAAEAMGGGGGGYGAAGLLQELRSGGLAGKQSTSPQAGAALPPRPVDRSGMPSPVSMNMNAETRRRLCSVWGDL